MAMAMVLAFAAVLGIGLSAAFLLIWGLISAIGAICPEMKRPETSPVAE
jgi:hypothetical protein